MREEGGERKGKVRDEGGGSRRNVIRVGKKRLGMRKNEIR